MTTIDVIIPVRSNDKYIRAITQASIDSLIATETEDIRYNIIVCEQEKYGRDYEGVAKTLHYDFPFNYNRVMNYGAKHCSNAYIMFCNNDLIYLKGFANALLRVAKCGYESLSPADPTHDDLPKAIISEGYGVEKDLKGYCIFAKRSMFDRIGGFDESLEFWYSDHLYKDQLIANGVKHARVTDSYVIHCHHCTLNRMDKKSKDDYTNGQRTRYEKIRKNRV